MKNAYHILRYGTHAEQKYFIKGKGTYTTIAINGNMVAHSPAAIASFISDMSLQNPQLTYFIDPITHAFQHDLRLLMADEKKEEKADRRKKNEQRVFNPEKIKKSVASLIQSYGHPLQDIIINEKRSLLPSDFNINFQNAFCDNVIQYQHDVLTNELNKTDVLDYIKFAEVNAGIKVDFSPEFIIAPYFFLDTDLIWLPINIEMLQYCIKHYTQYNIAAEIVLSLDVLADRELLSKIADNYISCGLNQVMVWIDNFNEHEVSKELLLNFVFFLKKFNAKKIPVINLYGGYFSETLIKLGYLNGIGHAFEYGENRSVIPVGGGLPTNKYYLYDLHIRLDYSIASNILFSLGYFDKSIPQKDRFIKYRKMICPCQVCKDILKENMDNFSLFESTQVAHILKANGGIQNRTYADTETKEKCVMHYQFSKYREFLELTRLSKDLIINSLEVAMNTYSMFFDDEALIYLQNWATTLKTL